VIRQMWAVVRGGADDAGEILAVIAARDLALRLTAELGDGHHAEPVRVLEPGGVCAVMHTWMCRAVVVDSQVDRVEQPVRLAGASQLLLDGDDLPADRVVVDDEAAALDASVLGASVRYVSAYSVTGDRARVLAERRAQELAEGNGSK
jgi:hypothetical protein